MRIERVVINASPLIILFRGHLESLLPGLFGKICIPEAVWSEVIGGGYRDESVSGLINAKWAKKKINRFPHICSSNILVPSISLRII